MIKKISHKRIDWLVNQVVKDDKLMQLKPVLAGGSMLSVYRAYRLYDSELKWRQLERAVCFNHKKIGAKDHLFSNKMDAFGDIDAWFFKESGLHNNRFGAWMLSEQNSFDSLRSFDETTNNWRFPEPLGAEYKLVKTSKWANSFRKGSASEAGFIFQVIKTPISSIDELFSTFDFTNCCVAYYDGTLYYDSRLDRSFESFSLDLNNPTNYVGPSMSKRIYAGLRAFKYSKRYLLDFSEELSEYIYNIYADIDSIDYSEYDSKVALVNDVYGRVLIPVSDFRDMVRTFEMKFKEFSKMKTFREEYALFLIDRKNLDIKEYLNGASGLSCLKPIESISF
jgi:hypothetical protein